MGTGQHFASRDHKSMFPCTRASYFEVPKVLTTAPTWGGFLSTRYPLSADSEAVGAVLHLQSKGIDKRLGGFRRFPDGR